MLRFVVGEIVHQFNCLFVSIVFIHSEMYAMQQSMAQQQGSHQQIFMPPRAPHLMPKVSKSNVKTWQSMMRTGNSTLWSVIFSIRKWAAYQHPRTNVPEVHHRHHSTTRRTTHRIHRHKVSNRNHSNEKCKLTIEIAYQRTKQIIYISTEHEDGRRSGEMSRTVLWNSEFIFLSIWILQLHPRLNWWISRYYLIEMPFAQNHRIKIHRAHYIIRPAHRIRVNRLFIQRMDRIWIFQWFHRIIKNYHNNKRNHKR